MSNLVFGQQLENHVIPFFFFFALTIECYQAKKKIELRKDNQYLFVFVLSFVYNKSFTLDPSLH